MKRRLIKEILNGKVIYSPNKTQPQLFEIRATFFKKIEILRNYNK